jgi:homoserine O-acetyltransferase
MNTLEPTHEGDCLIERFRLENGAELRPVTLHYTIYGELDRTRDNAVLVCHALSGSARVADWWPGMFGPDGFDPARHCIIGVNVLGSCYGSTGPLSPEPQRHRPYGPGFPLVTIRDMVRAQAHVLDHLGVERLRAVVGGSIGGMQALQWTVDCPARVEHCIAIGTAPLAAMGLALNHLQRQAIALDPRWRGGRYPHDDPPAQGLALARAMAMCSYKSAALFDQRFARRPDRHGEQPLRSAAARFEVAGYLDHQGEKFIGRFDANSYVVLSKAMDTFDLARGYQSEAGALRRIGARVLLAGISSDWLFPPADVRALAARMRAAGVTCDYAEIVSAHGHDAFLAEPWLVKPLLAAALAPTRTSVGHGLHGSTQMAEQEHPASSLEIPGEERLSSTRREHVHRS